MTNEEDELNFRKDNKRFNNIKYFRRYICYEYIKNTFKPIIWFSSFYDEGIMLKGKTRLKTSNKINNIMTGKLYQKDNIKINLNEKGIIFLDNEVIKSSDKKLFNKKLDECGSKELGVSREPCSDFVCSEELLTIDMNIYDEVLYFDYELNESHIKKIRNTLKEYVTSKSLKKFDNDIKYVQNFVVELTPLLKMKLDIDL